ncbi:dual specificity protein phosphatase 22 isoform X8 [Bubalus bubalis]|uniref:dual specificity protein phosphatase 22 isoform X8 n=1 Tax=Bubalus bubalis TaxID=89462 RepID=UPI001D10504F|nr:dual specificity protein phosphatase 22 isoform X8 [Bubalus bubalis]
MRSQIRTSALLGSGGEVIPEMSHRAHLSPPDPAWPVYWQLQRCQRCRAVEQEQGDTHSVCARQRQADAGGRDISKKVLNSSMSAASRARAAWFTDSRSAPLLSEGPGERAPCLLSSVLLWCPFHSETRVQNRAFHKRLKYKNVHFTRDSSTKTYVSQEVQVQKCSFHKRLRYKNVGFTRDSGTEMFISQEAQVQKCSFY